ncbi:MAG: hypothetical protein ABS55_00450 [Lautropia sp. SCN 70-15]|nr:MAG: hypothetical protein ABS55_00450 [Lautropia sp. SCN 70-15]
MADNDVSREDRQLPASERRLQRAREEGRVARSRDFGHFAVLGTALLATLLGGPAVAREAIAMVRSALRFGPVPELSPRGMADFFVAVGGAATLAVLPLVLALSVAAVLASVVPGGLVLSGKPLSIEASKINPVNGLRRIFSLRGAFDLGRLIVVALALAGIGGWFVAASLPEFVQLAVQPLAPAATSGAMLMAAGLAALVGVLAFVAAADLPFQWFRHRAELKMSYRELKQEAKESDGDPLLRARLRGRQREIAGRRMLAAVPTADVVVTNPTHFAVAIRYDEGAMGAPRVVAKGADLMAARIRELALGAGVPLVEAPPLARALHAHVAIDAEIPAALYSAVAQVLAYVYRLKSWTPGQGEPPVPPPAVEVPGELSASGGRL